jgi:predicted RNase H-like HicB family nuclease
MNERRNAKCSCTNELGNSGMSNVYTAILKQEDEWWIGWIEEVPGVNCQEATREELLESLQIALREALNFNRQDAIAP